MTTDDEGIICFSAGFAPSSPKFFPPSWAPDGGEPSPHFSIYIKAIILVTSSIDGAWVPPSSPRSGGGIRRLVRTGGTDGTGSLGVRGLRAAPRIHRDCNLIDCGTISSDTPLIAKICILS